MKQLLTLISLCLLSTGLLNAQAVVVNSPQELAGGYEFEPAAFGASLDMVWTADAIFVNDGSEAPTQGCNAAINAADINGKIALIDRGSCEFGLKCLNAEEAGAIAAIVINNAPGDGAIAMGAGQVGGQVTIPCVMIPYEVGQLIRTALVTETVNISLGDLIPPPPPANDLAMVNSNVLVPRYGIVPASQVQAEGDFVFTPGASVENRGVNDAPNYNIDVTIMHNPFGGSAVEVYNESFSSPDLLLAGDTTDLVTFPPFDPFSTGAGIYEYTYTVSSDSVDNAGFNNASTGSFTLSDKEIYSKATWDPNLQRPRVIATTTIAGGGTIEFITPLKIPYGEDYKIDSVGVEVRNSPGLAGISIEAYIYDWDDVDDNDILPAAPADELTIVGIALFSFPSDYPDNAAYLKLPILDILTLEETGVLIGENDKNFLVGVRYPDGGSGETVSFGFDSSIDYTRTEEWLAADTMLTDLDYGSLQADTYDPSGLPESFFVFTGGLTTSTEVILTSLISNTEEIAGLDKFELNLFPNPVADQLNVTLDFSEASDFVEYYIVNSNGRVQERLRREESVLNAQQAFDVSQLASGEYHMVIRTNHGYRTQSFVVAH